MKLTLTDTQQAIVDALRYKLDDGLANGMGTEGGLQGYAALDATAKNTIKHALALQFAAYMQAANRATEWADMTLVAGWTALAGGTYHTPSYRIEGDRVWLRGAATTILTVTTIATLPEGYRPTKAVTVLGVSLGGTTAPVVVTVNADGTVVAPTGTIALDGVSFAL